MKYEFSIISFFIGFIIITGGSLILVFHRQLADNLASGVSSYDKFKLWSIIICVVGFLVMINIHWFLLGSVLSIFIPGFGN